MKAQNIVKAMVTVLLVLGIGVARANYSFTLNSGTPATIDNANTFSASSWGTMTGSGTFATLDVSLNLTTTDPLFSISDLYVNLVHIDSSSTVQSTVLLDGTQSPSVLGAVSGYTQIVPVNLPEIVGSGLNGIWRLYVENTSSGGNVTLNSWNLISSAAVPEPNQIVSMLMLAGVGGLGLFIHRRRRA